MVIWILVQKATIQQQDESVEDKNVDVGRNAYRVEDAESLGGTLGYESVTGNANASKVGDERVKELAEEQRKRRERLKRRLTTRLANALTFGAPRLKIKLSATGTVYHLVMEGARVTFSCPGWKLREWRKVNVTYYNATSGNVLEETARVGFEKWTKTVHINPALPEDSGAYSCHVNGKFSGAVIIEVRQWRRALLQGFGNFVIVSGTSFIVVAVLRIANNVCGLKGRA